MNNADIIADDDQAYILVIILTSLIAVFVPIIIVLSPGLKLESPLVVSLFLLVTVVPGIFLASTDIRYFIANVITCIYMYSNSKILYICAKLIHS